MMNYASGIRVSRPALTSICETLTQLGEVVDTRRNEVVKLLFWDAIEAFNELKRWEYSLLPNAMRSS